MKAIMNLRARLFLGISSLMTLALLGLCLGVFSVIQMAQSQDQLIRNNFVVIEVAQQLRQNLGNQLALLLEKPLQTQRLMQIRGDFRRSLEDAIKLSQNAEDTEQLLLAREQFNAYDTFLEQSDLTTQGFTGSPTFSKSYTELRDHLVKMQQDALGDMRSEGAHARNRSILIAVLLGLIGLAVLVLGYITAHNFARRFSAPIEGLSKAADQIGQGDFNVVLPVSPIAELSTLIRRFGLMTESLRELKETNVEALLRGQQRLQALLDSIDDGLLIIDQRGQIEHANPVSQRQLAWSNEHIGLSLGEALSQPTLDDAVHKVLGDQPLEAPQDDLVIEAGGETRLLAWRLSNISDAQGRTVGAVLILRDVTSQRAFERVRNEFVLRASHELRTPVTGMHMAFGLLRERLKFGPESRESDLIQTVDEEMRRLVRLINDLLNFSRYQSGQQKLELRACDVGELLENVRLRFAGQAAEQQVALELDMQLPLPTVQIDRPQMERVFDNLIDNALRYTPAGGSIRLQARRHGERVILSVEDTGEGIPYSQQSRIFEPFVQIGRKQGGAGLGLALCKEIARLHGGRLGVHSRLGQGTVFYLALPI
jgi:NtrC-family two-component system sensor histidine kinase KinB